MSGREFVRSGIWACVITYVCASFGTLRKLQNKMGSFTSKSYKHKPSQVTLTYFLVKIWLLFFSFYMQIIQNRVASRGLLKTKGIIVARV